MNSSIEPIPELGGTTLVRHHHDKVHGVFEADCRRRDHGAIRLFRLRCDGVKRVDRWFGAKDGPQSHHTEITKAYREPLAEGRLLVTLDIATESEWIEIDCQSIAVAEIHHSDTPKQ